jgi:GNAT superfamily N-acetyltransferase
VSSEREHEAKPRAAPDIAVRYFRDGEEEAVLRLLQESFPVWPAVPISVPPIDHLRWKMRLAESDEWRHRVAEAGGRLVGAVLGWARPALLRGRPVLCGTGSDACVHPDYRGRGVMAALDAFTYPQRRRLAVNIVGGTSDPAMARLRKHKPDPRLPVGNQRRRYHLALDRELPPPPAAVAVRDVPSFDERTDAFWEQAARPFDLIMVRDRAYLSWRYADRRAGDFTMTIAEEGEHLLGYIVTCGDLSEGRAVIADLLALPGRLDAASALLHAALSSLQRSGFQRAVASFPERHPYRPLLDRAGFVLKRNKEVTHYRPTGAVPADELAFLQDPDAALHFTRGDRDVM